MNAETGEVLFEQNKDTKLLMASTTKIMTALICLEQENLDEEFTVNSEAIKVEGSSIGLQEGDLVTLRTLAWGMLLKSGNDAANSVAYRIAGNSDEFAKMMNQKAKDIGMVNSSFVTPSGLDDENHYSTAYDMAILTAEALKNEEFAKAVSSTSAKLTYGNPPYDRHLSNSNKLLKSYEGAIGVKTGFTKKAGRCLVSAAKREGGTLICVTLSAQDDWNVHRQLFDYGFSLKQNVDDEIFSQDVPVVNGEKETLAVSTLKKVKFPYLAKNVKIEKQLVLEENLYAPITVNQIIGNVNYLLNGVIIQSEPIVATEEINKKYTEPENFFDKFLDLLGI